MDYTDHELGLLRKKKCPDCEQGLESRPSKVHFCLFCGYFIKDERLKEITSPLPKKRKKK